MTGTTKSGRVAARRNKLRITPGLGELNTDTGQIRVRGIKATDKMDARWKTIRGTGLDEIKEREQLYAELTTITEVQTTRDDPKPTYARG